jgi:hypothetical protein
MEAASISETSGPLMIALMMEAAGASENSVNFYQTTWHYNPEDSPLHVSAVLLGCGNMWTCR